MTLGLSISVKKATKLTSIKHNNRDFNKEDWDSPYHEHIDPEKTSENIVLIQEDIHQKYEEIFGESVQDYNDKQKRKDRKIKDFYSKVQKDGNLEVQREFIVQVGNKDDFTNNPENWQLANEVLTEYVKNFEVINPNLKIYNAVIHNDEASPHLHLNVIPVASGYKKGVALQPSFNKALKQQGVAFDPKNNRSLFTNFRDTQVLVIENSLANRGISRDMPGTNRLKDVREYKKAMKQVQELKEQEVDLGHKIASKASEFDRQRETSKNQLNALEAQISADKSKLDAINQAIVEQAEIFETTFNVHQKHLDKLKKLLPDSSANIADTSKDDLFNKTAPFLPNRLGTDREEKAKNILELIKQAQLGQYTKQIMDENTQLRANQQKAIEQATAPLEKKIEEQATKIKKMEKWIDSVKDSLHTFKRDFGEKYEKFLIHFGINLKKNHIDNDRGLAQNDQELNQVIKGYDMNKMAQLEWQIENEPKKKPSFREKNQLRQHQQKNQNFNRDM